MARGYPAPERFNCLRQFADGAVPAATTARSDAYQYDLKGSGRGVVLLIRHVDYQVLVENEDPAFWWKAGCESVALRLKGLEAAATYQIKAYNGSVVRRSDR
jgi:hypothetical protein